MSKVRMNSTASPGRPRQGLRLHGAAETAMRDKHLLAKASITAFLPWLRPPRRRQPDRTIACYRRGRRRMEQARVGTRRCEAELPGEGVAKVGGSIFRDREAHLSLPPESARKGPLSGFEEKLAVVCGDWSPADLSPASGALPLDMVTMSVAERSARENWPKVFS